MAKFFRIEINSAPNVNPSKNYYLCIKCLEFTFFAFPKPAKLNINTIEQLFKQHYRKLCNVAHRIVNDRNASEDIVQEVFEKLWNKKDVLQITTNAEGYLIRATSNTALNYLVSSKRTVSFDFATEASLQVASSTPQNSLTYTEFQEKVKTALDKLPPKCKVIFSLSRFEDMKYREIAEHLNISVKTVENQMGIALEKLRKDLKPYLTREFIAIAGGIGISLILQLLSILLLVFFIRY